jgi:hypothetical protein
LTWPGTEARTQGAISFKSPATNSEAETPKDEQQDITATQNPRVMVVRFLGEIIFIQYPSMFKTGLIKKLQRIY